MNTSLSPALAVLVALIGLSAPMASGQANGTGTPPDACPSQAERVDGALTTDEVEEGVDVTDCDLVGFELVVPIESGADEDETPGEEEGAPTIEIPEPGHGIELSMFGEAEDLSYSVEVSALGALEYGEDPVPDSGGGGGSSANDPCTDQAWNHLDYVMNLNETFYVRTASFPGYLNESETRASFVDGVRAWTEVYDDCGLVDNVGATAPDGGGSNAPSSVQAAGCVADGRDATSVFTFGPLPANLYGGTCRHKVWVPGVQDYVVNGADVRLSDAYAWTNRPDRPDCEELDIQSVVTHEAGHFWGMGHVLAGQHPNLTMRNRAGNAFSCSDKMRTLGKGDVLGMRDWY